MKTEKPDAPKSAEIIFFPPKRIVRTILPGNKVCDVALPLTSLSCRDYSNSRDKRPLGCARSLGPPTLSAKKCVGKRERKGSTKRLFPPLRSLSMSAKCH